jgi:hypothetical protein
VLLFEFLFQSGQMHIDLSPFVLIDMHNPVKQYEDGRAGVAIALFENDSNDYGGQVGLMCTLHSYC